MKLSRSFAGLVAFAIMACWAPSPATAQVVMVDVKLALLVDVSGSINNTEFNLQKQGYVNAFLDASVQSAIAGNANGIAVTLIYWAGNNSQVQAVNWTRLTNAASATAFANAIGAANRPNFSDESTAIGNAINFGRQRFTSATGGGSGFTSNRNIMDVSGDGEDNDSSGPGTDLQNLLAFRQTALNEGYIINGLPIVTSTFPNLLNYYQTNVQGGLGSFSIAATGFSTFEDAVKQKIFREVVPEPSQIALSALIGLAALGRFGWRSYRKRNA